MKQTAELKLLLLIFKVLVKGITLILSAHIFDQRLLRDGGFATVDLEWKAFLAKIEADGFKHR